MPSAPAPANAGGVSFAAGTAQGAPLTDAIDCVVITHCHLDHCGALPYLTEILGYDGPLYMTQPTAALASILLKDCRQISALGDSYTTDDVEACLRRATIVALGETIRVDDGSCKPVGCVDSLSPSFDPIAVLPGPCLPQLVGCADTAAANFWSLVSSHDEAACLYPGCTDSSSTRFSARANVDDGSCHAAPAPAGCLDSRASNYSPLYAAADTGSCRFAGCADSSSARFDAAAAFDDGCSCAAAA